MAVRVIANHNIRAKTVRVIDEKGGQVGVLPLQEALQLAQQKGLDLIQITDKVDPPIAKLGEYGKYLYEQEKKEREARKHIGGELKEVRLTFNISPHDMETRAKQAEKFLKKGDRIRLTLPLRGRQKSMESYAREKIQSFLAGLEQIIPYRIEREVRREPRGLSMIIAKK